ncbi:1-(5-phosphoribosyl)-5-[(5-phosphoribosylamino)methylideneamino]imidazole-4-carboxamide isomerase [Clostridium sp. MT-14]|jgi:phosphoribosylformimino-5-aminoimidazole carboxamide ribotide isomerase|uniref:1-(5-phosphoribosyl)-5-[(5-phosphoribosylamino)methylideneamino] imidazole-4-carboxamide isomerase n=1 Tax=Clostridium aromativorans TaxID=2836848 RepID=A0ABS8N7E0_9CLOT|nr:MULTISPECIES: 1-(5-phosphoribosyl)-5-[(5-phosphoribosylamino)methylideneamino]imidazole-4-carboxamide isomerase [Clostridium]KAA8668686.1 1-(5-phosphoribosyl)-5-[(5-phosphoribosylamino)methylideneamino]imidazole-4-carboxamide isomerase [Clostridium sp. HV4-5-A1G]MCC9295708.1 1-(5-phosphoribosyl)-5-[(5-phosphoribosylamino)methylideneamino]imidazole-4-carboxamide isomerase [Clostridium aromativorans]CAB1243277.1 phosphoribosylformimino-5-aminoimidazole carboxamide ribotide isomerase [Clostridia
MLILPAIDLRNGKCVRLYQGKFERSEIVGEDPVKVALSFKKAGSEYIHMVDLDGALDGKIKNAETISKVVKASQVPVELGGGIRNLNTVEKLVQLGISRIILGTAALNDPGFVKEAVKKYGKKIAVGIDAKDGKVAINGWMNISTVKYTDFAKQMEDIGVETIIFTDISKDGTLGGPNLEQLSRIQDAVSCKIIASGGIKNIEDLQSINKMGIYGAITGKAIYAGNIDLKKAIKLCK